MSEREVCMRTFSNKCSSPCIYMYDILSFVWYTYIKYNINVNGSHNQLCVCTYINLFFGIVWSTLMLRMHVQLGAVSFKFIKLASQLMPTSLLQLTWKCELKLSFVRTYIHTDYLLHLQWLVSTVCVIMPTQNATNWLMRAVRQSVVWIHLLEPLSLCLIHR